MMWLKKNWWMLAIVAALFVISGVILIVAVTTHTEGGFQEVCWRADGTAVYDCAEPTEAISWEDLPITVSVRSYEGTEDATRVGVNAVRNAAAVWNEHIEIELIRVLDEPDPNADATLVWGAPIEPDRASEGGWVTHRRVNGRMTAEVHIARIATARMAYLITVHELGHLIGLAHDDFAASPMYGITRDDSGDLMMRFTRPTDYDREILRARYGSR